MQYLLLIYGNETKWAAVPDSEKERVFKEFGEFRKSIVDSKHYLGGNRLQSISSAATVRSKDSKTITTDGPFAETKEQLGGYFLIEAADQNEAIAIAARMPTTPWSCVEVRPVAPTPALSPENAS